MAPARRRPATRARSGPRSTPSCSSWSARTARRSSSSTTAAAPSAWRCGSTSWPPTAARTSADIARAHHGSLAREERTGRRGPAQVRRAALPGGHLVARARHRHGRGRPRAPGRVAEVGRARAAAHRPRRPQRRRRLARAASSPSSAPTCSSAPSSPSACARATSSRPSCRATRSTCSPSRSSRWPPAATSGSVPELHALVPRTTLRRAVARAARERARHARRPLPVGGVRRAAAADRLGPRRGTRSARARARASSPSPTPARSPTAASTACTCPTAGASASSTRRWSTRRAPGQTFLLGASTWRIEEITRDRVIVTPAPGAPGRDAVLARRRRRPARWSWARRSARSRARPSTSDPAELARVRPRRARRQQPVGYLREQREATRVVPSDRTIVIERFRDEIGDWRLCVLSPYGGRVHAAWALALSARIRDEFGPRVRRDLVRRRDHRPPARRRRAARPPTSCWSSPTSSRTLVVRELAARRCSARASARTPPRRCCSRAPTPASARRCGSSGSRRSRCSRWPSATASSRSCSRPTASACATCSTCPA